MCWKMSDSPNNGSGYYHTPMGKHLYRETGRDRWLDSQIRGHCEVDARIWEAIRGFQRCQDDVSGIVEDMVSDRSYADFRDILCGLERVVTVALSRGELGRLLVYSIHKLFNTLIVILQYQDEMSSSAEEIVQFWRLRVGGVRFLYLKHCNLRKARETLNSLRVTICYAEQLKRELPCYLGKHWNLVSNRRFMEG